MELEKRGRRPRRDWVTFDELRWVEGEPAVLIDMWGRHERTVGRVLERDDGHVVVRTRAGAVRSVDGAQVRRARLLPGLFRPYDDHGYSGDIVYLRGDPPVGDGDLGPRYLVVDLADDGRTVVVADVHGRRQAVDEDRVEHETDCLRRLRGDR